MVMLENGNVIKIVGQNNLKQQIKSLSKYPQFSILVGPRGSGKKLIANWIANHIQATPVALDNKVDSVRELIDIAHSYSGKVLFIISNGDAMTNAAKNSLLKISEEPPRNIYIILLLRDINNTLDTIKSRGIIFNLDNYSENDLTEYINDNKLDIPQEIIKSCNTINDLLIYDKDKTIWDYVTKVHNNISKVSLSNSFKIGNSLSLKKDSEGYDLELFWKLFNYQCHSLLKEDIVKYSKAIMITSLYLGKIINPNFNKVFLFDNWILEIRKAW